MTREEADFIGGMNMCDEISNEAYRKIMCHCEEQEPCEDTVSRKEVLNQIFYSTDNSGDVVLGSALRERIERLPSVTPQESVINKIRAEIMSKDGLEEALEIIDKYRAESEDKE